MKGGRVVVDKYGRTTAPDVWAFGDISSPYQLKHVANAEMRAVQHNLMADSPADYQEMPHSVVPAAIFTHPQIANVGLTEEQARKKGAEEGFPVTVKVQKYGDVAYGWAMDGPARDRQTLLPMQQPVSYSAHISWDTRLASSSSRLSRQ